MADRIHLGFEVGTGAEVSVPMHHLAVTGLTRQAGKTTAIEGLLSRLPPDFKALLFSTKRGELTFTQAAQVEPFYRQHTDWEYVESLLEAAMKERMRIERSFIINACKGAKSLRQVYNNIVRGRKEARRGFDEAIFTNLQAYFEKVLPQLEANPFVDTLHIDPGPNVMDLGHLSEEVQALVIAACLEEVWAKGRNTILVIPEAWAFLPQQRGNPVKWAAQHVIRQGGAVGVFLYLDSQDITGITKDVLKSVGVWLLGRQMEKNEVQRVLDQLPIPTKDRPKTEEVMTLPIGHFFVAAEDWCKKVYVQPAWLDTETARRVALGEIPAVGPPAPAELVPVLPFHTEVVSNNLSGQFTKLPFCPEYSAEEEDPMMIADLRVQLANAEIQRDTAREDLARKDLTLNESSRKVQEITEALEKVKKQVDQLTAEVEGSRRLRQALRELLGTAWIREHADRPAPLDEEAIVEKVLVRIGADRPLIQLAPLGALKHRFQQETVDRLVAQVQALEERPRRSILWLLSVGKPAHHRQICQALGFPLAGGSFVSFGKGIKDAVAAGLLTDGQGGLCVVIREKVATALESYGPSPEDIEATYQHLVAALANAGEKA
jgi:RNase P subunit RPR2